MTYNVTSVIIAAAPTPLLSKITNQYFTPIDILR